MPLAVGARLGPYQIEGLLGTGGMGEVYLARDTRLDRSVALKVLAVDFARDPEARARLHREARAISSLRHPNICVLFDVGSHDGLDYLVMERLEGETLATRLARGPLPLAEVYRFGTQLAEALESAHGVGLVHRDLKPGNAMLTPTGLKLLDFGLARPVAAAQAPSPTSQSPTVTTPLTAEGALVGTLPYMAPEQLDGREADARSDLFAVGAMLYEMAAGRPPFRGQTQAALIAAILERDPLPLREQARGIPAELERTIRRCLEKDPALRYASAAALAADLRRGEASLAAGRTASPLRLPIPLRPPRGARSLLALAGGVALVGLAAAAVVLWPRLRRAPADPSTILVLPLEVQGAPNGSEPLGRSLAEAIAIGLAQHDELRILPVPDGRPHGSGQGDARLARRLGAGQVLSGTVERRGEVFAARLQMTDVVQNRLRWGAVIEDSGAGLSVMAAGIAREIAESMQAQRPKRYDSPYHMRGTPAMAATPEFMEALGALRRAAPQEALAASERLIAMFPDEPDAQFLHVAARGGEAFLLPADTPERRRLESALLELARVDPQSPWPPAIQAIFLEHDDRDREALLLYDRVLARTDLTPAARGLVLGWRAWPHIHLHDYRAALEDLEEAVRQDPTNDNSVYVLSVALRRSGRYAEAVARARQAVALVPSHPVYHQELARGLSRMGRWEEAHAAYQSAALSGFVDDRAVAEMAHAIVLWRAGRKADAAPLADSMRVRVRRGVDRYVVACYDALSGRPDSAVAQLRLMAEAGEAGQGFAGDPSLAALTSHPGFAPLAQPPRAAPPLVRSTSR